MSIADNSLINVKVQLTSSINIINEIAKNKEAKHRRLQPSQQNFDRKL